jgi:hypothetical protein
MAGPSRHMEVVCHGVTAASAGLDTASTDRRTLKNGTILKFSEKFFLQIRQQFRSIFSLNHK